MYHTSPEWISAYNYKFYSVYGGIQYVNYVRGTAWWVDTTGDEGSAVCSLRAGLQCYKLPSLFHQWKQVITPYPFTSLMGFSAMLRSAVMEHPLMKIHMASCLKISAIHSSLSFFFIYLFFIFVIFPLQNCWEICWRFPLFMPK